MRLIGNAYDAAVEYGCIIIASVTLVYVFLAIIYDVGLRTAGYQPPISTSAVSEYAMLLLTASMAPYLVRHHGHVRITAVRMVVPPRGQAALSVIVALLGIAISAVMCWYAVTMGLEAHGRGEMDIRAIALPRSVLFTVLALGFGISAIEFARHLAHPSEDDEGERVTDGL